MLLFIIYLYLYVVFLGSLVHVVRMHKYTGPRCGNSPAPPLFAQLNRQHTMPRTMRNLLPRANLSTMAYHHRSPLRRRLAQTTVSNHDWNPCCRICLPDATHSKGNATVRYKFHGVLTALLEERRKYVKGACTRLL